MFFLTLKAGVYQIWHFSKLFSGVFVYMFYDSLIISIIFLYNSDLYIVLILLSWLLMTDLSI